MRKHIERILALVLLLAGSQLCPASTITLTSSSGGIYDYVVTITPGETLSLQFGDTITLSGLSGVTGASTIFNPALCFVSVSTFTSSSVVFEEDNGCVADNGTAFPIAATGTLVVDSSVLTTGPVNFAMETGNEGTVTGSTIGPVSTVPEPPSLILLEAVMMGLVASRHRFAKK